LRSLLRHDQVDAELRSELDFHLEQQTKELVARGMDPARAREAAVRAMGDLSRYEEECRDTRGTRGLEVFLQDLRYGVRTLRLDPVFTAIAVLTLAVGIGANTAIFTLADALLVRNLSVRAPDELVLVGNPARTNSLSEGSVRGDLLSLPMYRELVAHGRAFSGILASGRAGRVVVGDVRAAEPEYAIGRLVSGNYFEVLGVAAGHGRTFGAEDDRRGVAPVVVISDDFWSRRFARDPRAVGGTLLLNGRTFTVVGVARRGFLGDIAGVSIDFWAPIAVQPQLNRGRDFLDRWDIDWLLLIGRRAPGVSYAAAERNLKETFARVTRTRADGAIDPNLLDMPEDQRELEVAPGGAGASALRARYAQPLRALAGIVALVLLIACVNVASLLLARADARQKEIDVRLALGAGRGRLVRQLLTESLLLALAGGACGLAVAFWSGRVLLTLVGVRPSAALFARPEPRVLAFTLVVSLLTGLLFGLVPALRATRKGIASALRQRARGVVGRRRGTGGGWPIGKVLVVTQLALCLLLLTSAGLFLRTLLNLRRVDLGYRTEHLLLLDVDPLSGGVEPDDFGGFIDRMLARLAELPGVEAVTFSENGLFSGTESATRIAIVGRPEPAEGENEVSFDEAGPRYFATVGIPIRRGRDIAASDRAGAPLVAVVNEAMAKQLFPGSDPLGQRFHEVTKPDVVYTVVGVAADAHDHDLRRPVDPRYYTAAMQSGPELSRFVFEVKAAQPQALVAPVRAALHAQHPGMAIIALGPIEENLAEIVRSDGLVAKLSSAFGLVALLLAAIGLYGVISQGVARRTNEIGVRLVLGAKQRGVLAMVVGETLRLALVGTVCGLPAAILGGRLIATRLFGVSAHDLPTLAVAVGTLVVIAVVAGAVPGLRASPLEPTVALRHE